MVYENKLKVSNFFVIVFHKTNRGKEVIKRGNAPRLLICLSAYEKKEALQNLKGGQDFVVVHGEI